jgi:hypothetical protein
MKAAPSSRDKREIVMIPPDPKDQTQETLEGGLVLDEEEFNHDDYVDTHRSITYADKLGDPQGKRSRKSFRLRNRGRL